MKTAFKRLGNKQRANATFAPRKFVLQVFCVAVLEPSNRQRVHTASGTSAPITPFPPPHPPGLSPSLLVPYSHPHLLHLLHPSTSPLPLLLPQAVKQTGGILSVVRALVCHDVIAAATTADSEQIRAQRARYLTPTLTHMRTHMRTCTHTHIAGGSLLPSTT